MSKELTALWRYSFESLLQKGLKNSGKTRDRATLPRLKMNSKGQELVICISKEITVKITGLVT